MLGDMKYLLWLVKRSAEAVGVCTEENWYVKRVNSLCNMASGRFNIKKMKKIH